MQGRTELSAAVAAAISALFGLLSATGVLVVPPEIVSSINGFMVPVILIFLAARVTKVETKAEETSKTANRIEAAQPVSK